MTQQAGLDYDVSLETEGGAGLDFHYKERHALIVKPWDVVLLQGYSTLDQDVPGDPGKLIHFSGLLARALHQQNPRGDDACHGSGHGYYLEALTILGSVAGRDRA